MLALQLPTYWLILRLGGALSICLHFFQSPLRSKEKLKAFSKIHSVLQAPVSVHGFFYSWGGGSGEAEVLVATSAKPVIKRCRFSLLSSLSCYKLHLGFVSPHVLLLIFSGAAAASSMLSKRAKSPPHASPRNSIPHLVVTFRNFPNPIKSRACLACTVAEQRCGDKFGVFLFCFFLELRED